MQPTERSQRPIDPGVDVVMRMPDERDLNRMVQELLELGEAAGA